MSPLPLAPLGRRALLGGALASTAVLAGCDSADPVGATAGRDRAAATGAATQTPDDVEQAEDPDAALVEQVARELDGLGALVAAVTAATPRLARPLAGLARTHEEHRAALPAAAGEAPPVPRPRGSAADQWALVRAREARGVRRLEAAALAARSGALARLVAGMSAGTLSHLTALPEEVPSR